MNEELSHTNLISWGMNKLALSYRSLFVIVVERVFSTILGQKFKAGSLQTKKKEEDGFLLHCEDSYKLQ